MRYKVILAYNGLNYAGFQSQENADAIQDIIERALETIFRHPVKITGASRTDRGVHAYGQVFHFDEEERDCFKLKGSINSLIPKDIHVVDVKKVDNNFHARYGVKEKTYVYLINNGERDPFLEGRAYQKTYPLDNQKMKEVAELFIGTHDFGSFNTSPIEEYPNQTRTIYECSVNQKGKRITITVRGDGFLRHMVRMMVGSMVDVARGHIDINEIKERLEKPTKDKRRYSIDACGLYLVSIKY